MRAPKTGILRWMVHAALLSWLVLLAWDFAGNHLGAEPIRAVELRTGKTALVVLVLALACSPANSLLGLCWAAGLRRTLGLYAFAYASVHFVAFVGLDYQFDAALLREALFEKRYALAGLASFLLLLPLAATSTPGWRRRLGRRWTWLHRGAYPAAGLAVVHYLWLVKADTSQPLQYGALVLLLLLLRLRGVREIARVLLNARPRLRM